LLPLLIEVWQADIVFSMPKTRFYRILLAILVIPAIWVLVQVEFEKPRIVLTPPIKYMGKTQLLSINVSDRKTGLRRIHVVIRQNRNDQVIHSQGFPYSLFGSDRVHYINLDFKIEPRALGFHDGEATLMVSVRDYSFNNLFKGNQTMVERTVSIDTSAPLVNILTPFHYVNQGGSGLTIYEISEDVARSGVRMGDLFFPGFKSKLSEKEVYLAYFAVPYDASPHAEMAVMAVDFARNATSVQLPHHVRKKKFRKDKIRLSEGFLNKVRSRFASFPDSPDDSLELFLWVNGKLRKDNHERIVEICSKTHPSQLWDGPFLRMKHSKTMAGFADERSYFYDGREIDRQVHLGVDLASTGHAPVEAANNGIVVFADELGIYGKSIILDHGLGLFSMYGHLSSIQVSTEQKVSKGEVIGHTGSTGLAGGDHLHLSMVVSGVFVNPVEWWDDHWMKDNVLTKLRRVGG
jgi:hypothetical protein